MIREGDESVEMPLGESWVTMWNKLAPVRWPRSRQNLRIKTDLIREPFTPALVRKACRHYLRHGEPWLPLAEPEEAYARVWVASETAADGYALDERPADDGDPWDEANEWIRQQTDSIEAFFRGEPAEGLDGNVRESVIRSLDKDFELEGTTAEVWDAMTTDDKLRFVNENLGGPSLDYYCEMLSDGWLPNGLIPCSRPVVELDYDGLDLPIGHVGCADGGMPGNDAQYLVVKPRIALTFLQVWLDAEGRGIRLEIEE